MPRPKSSPNTTRQLRRERNLRYREAVGITTSNPIENVNSNCKVDSNVASDSDQSRNKKLVRVGTPIEPEDALGFHSFGSHFSSSPGEGLAGFGSGTSTSP